jgi:histidine ammonia-lyase
MSKNTEFHYGLDRLTAKSALQIAGNHLQGTITEAAEQQIKKAEHIVNTIVRNNKTVYGINTGFGPLCTTKISAKKTEQLQYNILRSHSVGVGENVPPLIAKLIMILKVHSLARGFSGIRLETVRRIIWHITNDILPVIPSQGSVGASGDLAPLSHAFLPLIGLGKVQYQGSEYNSLVILKKFNKKPLKLGPKEGLALINGTQFITAYSVWAVDRFKNCLDHADIIGAMTLEALLGSVRPFLKDLHAIRPYRGTMYVAYRLNKLLQGSEMVASHQACTRVQDPYSIRCMPQVHGASRNAWLHLKEIVEIELNSVTDNPIVLDEDNAISGGNFHGQPIALPLDYAAMAVSELGNISDRRTFLLLEGGYEGLPKLLMKNIGINSGFMIPQYTSAALVSENKGLCFPASVDSIPTSLGQEDHVSMGSISSRKINRILDNLENILAVELLSSAQAFDFRRPKKSSTILEACHNYIREFINHADADRIFGDDLVVAANLIKKKQLLEISTRTALKQNIKLHDTLQDIFDTY